MLNLMEHERGDSSREKGFETAYIKPPTGFLRRIDKGGTKKGYGLASYPFIFSKISHLYSIRLGDKP